MKKRLYILIVIGLAFLGGAIWWLATGSPEGEIDVPAEPSMMGEGEVVVTPEPRASPLPWRTDECISWREVTSQMEGQTVCVYGTIRQIAVFYDTNGGQPGPRAFYFKGDPSQTNSFGEPSQIFFTGDRGPYPNAQVGVCVYVRGVISAGFIDTDIPPHECESWMKGE